MKAPKRRSAKDLAGPLRQAAQAGDTELVRELLAQGADPDRRSTSEPTPLIVASAPIHKTYRAAVTEPTAMRMRQMPPG